MLQYTFMVYVVVFLCVNSLTSFLEKTHTGYIHAGIDLVCAVAVLCFSVTHLKNMLGKVARPTKRAVDLASPASADVSFWQAVFENFGLRLAPPSH
jgi:hypothetical protein